MLRIALVSLLLISAGCETAAALGAACSRSSECASPLACSLGRCRSECRLNRDCPIATRCLLSPDGSGACSVATDVCSASSCEGALLCVEGRCVAGCEPAAPVCPADARCVAIPGTLGGLCDDARDVSDGGTSDASDLDAATPDASCGVGACGRATAIAVSLGDFYSGAPCVIRNEGEVWCWGGDPLGDGDPTRADCAGDGPCSPVPVRVLELDVPSSTTQPLAGAMSIAAAELATCVVVQGGALRCWGFTGNDQIPVANPSLRVAQRGIDAMSRPLAGITQVTLGRYTGFALQDGAWVAWGQAAYGSLTDPTSRLHGPEPVPLLDGLQTISGGNDYACGIAAGTVRCWGINGYGELGRSPFGTDVGGATRFDAMPGDVVLSREAVAVASGIETACAIDVDGHVWCWGHDQHGALGNFAMPSDPCECQVTPVRVDLPSGVLAESISSASAAPSTCVVTRGDGLVYCWGESPFGQAGVAGGDVLAPEVPIRISGGAELHATSVAVGLGTACAIDLAGEVWCWGRNSSGELGIGTSDLEPHPTATRVVFP